MMQKNQKIALTANRVSSRSRPGASHEGPRAVGIGQRRGCRDRVSWRLHPAAGSHLPAEGTAPPFAVAPFRVIAPYLAPQKPYAPLRSTAGFRFKPNHPVRVHSVDMLLYFDPNRDGI